MALVSYSDSEASDSEPSSTPAPTPKPATSTAPKSKLVDSSNPRKIRVALPDLKPENINNPNTEEDGPARKKPRIGGGGGGAFSGFNSFLPAPKRNVAETNKKAGTGRKVFSLKTGATPGFDRGLDEEMRNERPEMEAAGAEDDKTIPKAGSLRGGNNDNEGGDGVVQMKPEEVKLKGNPMMFKPLSVGRASAKKKKVVSKTPAAAAAEVKEALRPVQQQISKESTPVAAPAPKPKVSLFSLGASESATATTAPAQGEASYEPLVYTADTGVPATGPEPEAQVPAVSSEPAATQTLDNIADDLNLSRSQRRHLFGRNADASNSRILHFNTDREYAHNQELLHETDLAAAQHNPVRSIAPGKHTLQQLVNVASSQREALEESFATGRRNKKEAGSKYGW
ncbi:mitotic checkpoint regulator, MAD2B-interacting-domain-containing protein [Aspergillus leporis]|uniref:Mitotic checkpoint regulator, MAD2B-interacting-domain-containing protein n=1 Tax=Aspergillus leporis TaxID=41062 RepID=A0A5N5X1J1_9EURO|nr:mitotic checkpoint regulator, MAD2B-interacting-domain-containing protein [Aspergillus leporis]